MYIHTLKGCQCWTPIRKGKRTSYGRFKSLSEIFFFFFTKGTTPVLIDMKNWTRYPSLLFLKCVQSTW
ncbi:hypothetical protein EUGRSUZ_A01145 [Eucalyptus grandis]|uniref:Uncharacterized protein n=2 Tax=Eucalyptus grandis TaxID=71139 RepID=A0ACC3M2E8_EUCGR|nr:hypothetical protein EUGRSUZ_A01145 [Eucalyptus grandis]